MELPILEELFNLIECKIKEDCSFVNSVSMYQNQDLFQQNNLGYKPTCVFLDYQNLIYTDNSFYEQECSLDVVIRVVVEEYSKNYFKALSHKQGVVKALHNYINLTRVSEQIDNNADGLYIYTITFSASFTENLEPDYTLIGGTSGNSWSFNQTLTQDSNNDSIFTGWASTSGIA
jgi:hypothetical protein